MTRPSMSYDTRTYADRADLLLLQEFASKALSSRFPLDATWHPGDFSWQLMPNYDRPHRVRMWEKDGAVEAVAMFESADKLLIELLPSSDALLPEIMARAERASRRAGQAALKVRAYDGDGTRIAALEALGYRRSAPDGVCFRVDLSQPLRMRTPPSEFRLRDSVDIDPERRAAAHRDAWNDLKEIGLPDARSSFSTEVYLGLKTAPDYDPALDILVQADDGTLVANCICWRDDQCRIGSFEPVGTHSHYRRRGLARLAVHEGLRRLKECGMRYGRVSTAHFNVPAIATYAACGFTLHDRSNWWTKEL